MVTEPINVEITLFPQLTKPPEDRRNSSALYNEYKLSDLQKFTDGQSGAGNGSGDRARIDWLRYFEIAFENVTGVNITENERIIVADPQFLLGLQKLVTETPARILCELA